MRTAGLSSYQSHFRAKKEYAAREQKRTTVQQSLLRLQRLQQQQQAIHNPRARAEVPAAVLGRSSRGGGSATFASPNSGRGTPTDGGRGTPADSGHGTPADSGRGTPTDGGHGTPADGGRGTPAGGGGRGTPIDLSLIHI